MRNLSIQQQKQIVGGAYYWKIFTTRGEYLKDVGKVGPYDYEVDAIDACRDKIAELGGGLCGRVYDSAGNITERL